MGECILARTSSGGEGGVVTGVYGSADYSSPLSGTNTNLDANTSVYLGTLYLTNWVDGENIAFIYLQYASPAWGDTVCIAIDDFSQPFSYVDKKKGFTLTLRFYYVSSGNQISVYAESSDYTILAYCRVMNMSKTAY